MLNLIYRTPRVGLVAPGLLALVTVCGTTAAPVSASIISVSGFEGPYDPTNWTLINENADGFVDTTDAPNSITLTGGDDGSFSLGSTSFVISAPADGTVAFDYDYSSFNVDGPFFDPFGIVVDEIFTQLTDNFGPDDQSGSFSFDVEQGDSFGFAVQTVDNLLGPASATISSFEAPAPVPEPTTVLGLLGVSGLGLVLQRKKCA
ncbi:MAG: PEP-CTERM sorting domain-containing protein [Cyanophyceae cyanobacterium]